MGILNVTPDSFSDGGRFLDVQAAVAHARSLVDDGADLIDIGGESTRPGSEGVSDDEQIRRTEPVIRAIRAAGISIPISIDTRSAAASTVALDAGADIINDVSAARHDPNMPALLASTGVPFVAMHMQGTPETMQAAPAYHDVVREIRDFFEVRAHALEAAGVDLQKMMIDPGIGFGKTAAHNWTILRHIDSLLGRWPVLVGTSRKRFLGDLTAQPRPADRIAGTAATVAHCALTGVDMVRVHDVRLMRQIVEVCQAIRNAG
jgi:dihydropteroate synthase